MKLHRHLMRAFAPSALTESRVGERAASSAPPAPTGDVAPAEPPSPGFLCSRTGGPCPKPKGCCYVRRYKAQRASRVQTVCFHTIRDMFPEMPLAEVSDLMKEILDD